MATATARSASSTRVRPGWELTLERIVPPAHAGAVHLVTMTETDLARILSGEKDVEARFCQRPCAPLGMVSRGDVLLLRPVRGAVAALAHVEWARNWNLTTGMLPMLRKRFDRRMGVAGDEFWASHADAAFCTLVGIAGVQQVEPVCIAGRDRHGWRVLREGASALQRSRTVGQAA